MNFEETKLQGAYCVDIEPRDDSRGMFARTFCQQEFADAGLLNKFVQCNISVNNKRGTLRGMHFQEEPFPEGKLVRCTRGAILDVIVDLRRESKTFCQWTGVELTEENHRALYVPFGFAHGFQTLTNDAVVFYQMTEMYHGELASGVRWNDPAFSIDWPISSPVMSERDASYPDFVR